ncbi:MAG TPA: hypothetical protein VFJ86_13685 [Usitatibacter sp.]|jgi:hypothetical protein|nr:hypothetical protein [Usitatibacter sp.]
MKREVDDPRRKLLLRLLASGLLGADAMGVSPAFAQLLGDRPGKLPPGRSVYRVKGDVRVDGQRATLETHIAPGARVVTGDDGELIYAVGDSAFIARARTEVLIEATKASSLLVAGYQLLRGKLLSVFGSGRPLRLRSSLATIGIRGTGVYMESDPGQTYFCTCYGTTDVQATADAQSRTTVASTHHDRPLYILSGEPPGRNIRDAPFIDHTDQELMLIEALVGRQPPFVFPRADYNAPRRTY